jgi:tRNA (guanine-N7-)-methyltransferase
MGQALLQWAVESPDWNLFGIDVYQPGIGSLLLGLERRQLTNVRVLEAAAEDVFATSFRTSDVDEVRIFFPDPWPKKRHQKRRLIQAQFVALLADRLRPGGRLWLATDWEPYARWMRNALEAEPELVCESPTYGWLTDGPQRGETRFEARGKRLGHAVFDLVFQRKRCSTASR